MPRSPANTDCTTEDETMRDAYPYDRELIDRALAMTRERWAAPGDVLADTRAARDFALLQLSGLEREHFCCAFLDSRHRLIEWEVLFMGSVDRCTVHAREVVKAALRHNAAAVILAHNHPSGYPQPSPSDMRLTDELRQVLAMLDVRVIDHLVVGREGVVSMVMQGLM